MGQKVARQEKWYNNVTLILMGDGQTVAENEEVNDKETEVVKALQDKYDALKDKLLMEVM